MSLGSLPFTVLVNSSDGFEDCWDPFFTLLKKYWPQRTAPIVLNTERKEYRHADLSIKCTMVQGSAAARLTWSECLLSALAQIETPLILYLQEDYFIHQPILDDKVRRAVGYMLDNPEVKCIGLTRLGYQGPYDPHPTGWLQTIRPKAKYRLSTQAALWRVECLRSYLVPVENGWMFEIYGTWRAHRRSETFLCARFDTDSGGPAIDYLHTGIVKGQWLREIQGVFASNGIVVDYSQRGFYSPKHPLLRRLETVRRLLERPAHMLKQLT